MSGFWTRHGGRDMAEAVSPELRAELNANWWVPLIQGIAAVILGILLLTYPGATLTVIAGIVGFYWLISGVMNLVAMFVDHSMWGWKLFIGILGILAGLVVVSNIFQHPLATTIGLATIYVWVLGLQGIIIGVIEIIQAFQGAGWGRGILGVLSLIIGIFLMGNAFLVSFAVPFVFGLLLIIFGGLAIFMAFKYKNV